MASFAFVSNKVATEPEGRGREIARFAFALSVVGRMKAEITLKLDAELLREVRALAAEEGSSVSAMLSQRLEAMVQGRKAFE